MSKEPIIETNRLILRPLTLDDAGACYSWNSDDRVTKYMSYSTYTDIGQTIDWIKSTFIDKDEWIWAFVLKEKNKVIGTGSIGPNAQMKDYWGIGYNLHYDYWHKGYCTEAMKAIIDFAFAKAVTDKRKPLRYCKHCGKIFYAGDVRSEFCSPRCRNQFNVYKSRAKH